MYIDTTPEQKAFQAEARALFARLMTPELREELVDQEGGGPRYYEAMEELAAGGWLGVGWPKQFGGQERPPIEEFLFFDEAHRSGFPIPLLTLNTVGPTLIRFGTEEQKADFLPRILAGKLHFSIGYTEPSAGTDLASLVTTAVRDGDDYVINGQKIFISLADFADYLWCACRTDPDAAKHKGISMILVPMNAEGVSHTPIRNLGDSNIHAVYLDNVRVPVSNRVGPENGGWKMITTQLNHERIALMMVGPLARLSAEVRDWARDTEDDGTAILDKAWVRRNLATVEAKLEVLRLMNWRQAWKMGTAHVSMQEASGLKVFGSEFYVEGYRLLLEILGVQGMVKHGDTALLRGELERHYRATLVLTFGGGVNEVQRDIIAMAGLRLPRAPR
ncbi:MAG: acyl-CoA dehydrogenase family protein [Proteobacteria bacterium]|nr:acyl-CoA dehydrogenase family protein [Pseudomonadota bacterium]